MGEHRPYKPRVAGSNPVPPTKGGVVQFWLERRPVTPEVASSSLVVPAIEKTRVTLIRSPFFIAM